MEGTNYPTVRLTLKQLNMVALWNYTAKNQDCGLCGKNLMIPVKDMSRQAMDSDVAIGICGHSLHSVCINNKLINDCPCCNATWEISNNIGQTTYMYNNTKSISE